MANQELVSFFEDPQVGDGILTPGMSGLAIVNIRRALNLLGYNIRKGDYYDNELVEVVRQFQTDRAHSSCDGLVGPGTRKQLAMALLEDDGPRIFSLLLNPAKYSRARISDQKWQDYRIHFYDILSRRFDDEELSALCFRMGLEYKDFPASTRDGKARELVNLLERRDLIYKLIQVGQELRSDIKWEPK